MYILDDKIKNKPIWMIIVVVLAGIAANLTGRVIVNTFELPFWLDCVGTVISAAVCGPLWGGIAGGMSNVIIGLVQPTDYAYVIINVIVGVVSGMVYPKDKNDFLALMSTAGIIALLCTVLCTPLNIIVYGGLTGHIWGDAMFSFFSSQGVSSVICAILSELYLEFPDKCLTFGLSFLFFRIISRIRISFFEKMLEMAACIIIAAAVSSVCLTVSVRAESRSEYEYYKAVTFEGSRGLDSLETNAIAQTDDGIIWIGNYSGLYRYDGVNFLRPDIAEGIANVMCLFVDSKGILWIGTNDNGIFTYDIKSGEVEHYTVEKGLSASSVRCICEGGNGTIYAGTVNEISAIRDGEISSFSNMGIFYVKSICVQDDMLAGVTNGGVFFVIKNGRVIKSASHWSDEEVIFNVVANYSKDSFLIGSSSSDIYLYNVDKDEFTKYCSTVWAKDVQKLYNCGNGDYFVCADSAFGYLAADRSFLNMTEAGFASALSDCIMDKDKNIWLASNKLGVAKYSENPFKDITKKGLKKDHVVNAVVEYMGAIIVGTDDGLYALDSRNYTRKHYGYLLDFGGLRIRGLLVDSKNNLWVCCYGADGLAKVTPDGKVYRFGEKDGTMGSRFRSAIELKDGTIVAASSTGITYLRNDKVIKTVGEEDGLKASQVLCLLETEDGRVMAGTDGAGVYSIRDGEIVDCINEMDGLNALVVMKIVKCREGFLYVTSAGIYFDRGNGSVNLLKNFPYSNNYDIHITPDHKVWIPGSAGMFLVMEDDLLKNEPYSYMLYNKERGFDTTFTANAWSLMRDNGEILLCCSDSVRCFDTTKYPKNYSNYDVSVSRVVTDNEVKLYKQGESIIIPAGSVRTEIYPAIANYDLSNPLIHIYLEGYDEMGVTAHQDNLENMNLIKIPAGKYKYCMEVKDELTGEVVGENAIEVIKEAEFYETARFKYYTYFMLFVMVVYITWILARSRNASLLKRQYVQIEQARDEADRANNAKSLFLANMSHEIRTPINAIIGMNEMALRECRDEKVAAYMEDIRTASENLLSVVNDILDFSKIEADKLELIENGYSLPELIKEIADLIGIKAQDKRLEFKITADEKLPCWLKGDVNRVRQIMVNLLNNAVKYTEYGSVCFEIGFTGNIEVSKECTLVIKVKDTGIGIKSADRDKLFESFTRVDEKKNRNIEGTGLGLAITSRLVDMMKGEIQFESEYGQGSEFIVRLPQLVLDATTVGDISEWINTHHKKRKHGNLFVAPKASVLVVDDNEMNLKVAKGLLEGTEMKIECCKSGVECLHKATNNSYDIVLMDHMMPEMDGIETMERLKNLAENKCTGAAFIVMTANALVGMKENYIKAGFDDYLGKPVDPVALEEMLIRYLPPSKVVLNNRDEAVHNDASEQIKADNDSQTQADSDDEDLFYIDRRLGIEYSGGMEELYEEIIEEYCNNFVERSKELKEAAEKEDLNAYRIASHTLKSNSKTIGALKFAERAYEHEMAAKASNTGFIHEDMDKLLEEYGRLVDKLKKEA